MCGSHQVERAEGHLGGAPAVVVGGLQHLLAPFAARVVRHPAGVRGVHPAGATRLEDLRQPVEAFTHDVAVELRELPDRCRQAVLSDHHLAAVSSPLEDAEGGRVAEVPHQLPVLGRTAPGSEDGEVGGVRRGMHVLDSVPLTEVEELVAECRAEDAGPGQHLFVEHRPDEQHRVEHEVLADVRVVESRAGQERRAC